MTSGEAALTWSRRYWDPRRDSRASSGALQFLTSLLRYQSSRQPATDSTAQKHERCLSHSQPLPSVTRGWPVAGVRTWSPFSSTSSQAALTHCRAVSCYSKESLRCMCRFDEIQAPILPVELGHLDKARFLREAIGEASLASSPEFDFLLSRSLLRFGPFLMPLPTVADLPAPPITRQVSIHQTQLPSLSRASANDAHPTKACHRVVPSTEYPSLGSPEICRASSLGRQAGQGGGFF